MILPVTPRGRPLGWVHPSTRGRVHLGVTYSPGAQGVPNNVRLGNLPPVYDQGQVGSCTANAIAGAIEILQNNQGLPSISPDRMAIYYQERALEGTTGSDAGAMVADGVKVVSAGYGPETLYDPSWGPDWTTAPAPLATNAPRLVNSDPLVIDPVQVIYALAAGFPVVIGVQIPESWETLTGDVLALPGAPSIGGHAVCLVGYEQQETGEVLFWLRNSWGSSWGNGGYAWMPEEYLTLVVCGEVYALRAVRNLQP